MPRCPLKENSKRGLTEFRLQLSPFYFVFRSINTQCFYLAELGFGLASRVWVAHYSFGKGHLQSPCQRWLSLFVYILNFGRECRPPVITSSEVAYFHKATSNIVIRGGLQQNSDGQLKLLTQLYRIHHTQGWSEPCQTNFPQSLHWKTSSET